MSTHLLVRSPRVFRWVPDGFRGDAARLQHKGLTLSEIAKELNVPRKDVVRVLYSAVVRN